MSDIDMYPTELDPETLCAIKGHLYHFEDDGSADPNYCARCGKNPQES